MEALQANVERLNAYKSKLVVFPKSGKAEEATQFQGVFMAKHHDRNSCGRCGNTFK